MKPNLRLADDGEGASDKDFDQASGKPRNLGPVLKIIPPECYDNPTWKGLAYIARDVSVYALALFALTRTDTWYWLIPLEIVAGFIVAGLFVLSHDIAHGSLFQSKKLSDFLGRATMLPTLHVYEAWAYGHNRVHHGHTVRQQFDFVWHPLTVEDYEKLTPLQKLRTKLEWSWAGASFYYGREIWWNRIINWEAPPKWKEQVDKDRRLLFAYIGGFALFCLALGFSTYGTLAGALWMVVKLFVIPSWIFIHMIGWTVYVHHINPEIKWFSRRDWNPFHGQMEGTTVWLMGPLLNFFWHNIFVHIPHHVDMRIPFYNLPKAEEAIKKNFPDDVKEVRLSPALYVQTTKVCKLYDFEKQQWLPYPN